MPGFQGLAEAADPVRPEAGLYIPAHMGSYHPTTPRSGSEPGGGRLVTERNPRAHPKRQPTGRGRGWARRGMCEWVARVGKD